jgi:hypothetical protein
MVRGYSFNLQYAAYLADSATFFRQEGLIAAVILVKKESSA